MEGLQSEFSMREFRQDNCVKDLATWSCDGDDGRLAPVVGVVQERPGGPAAEHGGFTLKNDLEVGNPMTVLHHVGIEPSFSLLAIVEITEKHSMAQLSVSGS